MLEQLWEHVSNRVAELCASEHGGSDQPLLPGSILKMYCTKSLCEALSGTDPKTAKGMADRQATVTEQGSNLRLLNAKLIQMLMTWVIRQGPLCVDVAGLQRMQQFCGSRLDARLARGLVSKLDAIIQRKQSDPQSHTK